MRTFAGCVSHGDIASASADGNAIVLVDYGNVFEKYVLGFYVEAVRAGISLV